MSVDAFGACLACGLRRGEVNAAECVIDADRTGFTLTLSCSLTPARSAELATSLEESRPALRELRIETPHGSWRWSQGALTPCEGGTTSGVRFVARTDERIDDSDFWERVLTAFRVRLAFTRERNVPRVEGHYDAADIVVLEFLDAVRRRPEMYLGQPLDPARLVEIVLEHAALGWLAGSAELIQVDVSPVGTVTVRDDGVPFSFEKSRDGVSWVQNSVARAGMAMRQWRRADDRARRDFGAPPPIAFANALSSEFVVESSEGAVAHRQRYVRGRALNPELIPPWSVAGTRVSFTPDLNLFDEPLDLPRVRAKVERVASLCPGREILLNGESVSFDTFLAAVPRHVAPDNVAWNDAFFTHTIKRDAFILRCALGLSRSATGRLECLLNFDRAFHREDQRYRGDHVDAVLAAIADAVRLPSGRSAARELDVVGIVSLEIASPKFDHAKGAYSVSLEAGQIAAIRESFFAPVSVFLDGIPDARETLAERWRRATLAATHGEQGDAD